MVPTGAAKASRSLNKYLREKELIKGGQTTEEELKTLNIRDYEEPGTPAHLLASRIAAREIGLVVRKLRAWIESDKSTRTEIEREKSREGQIKKIEQLVQRKAEEHAEKFKVQFSKKSETANWG